MVDINVLFTAVAAAAAVGVDGTFGRMVRLKTAFEMATTGLNNFIGVSLKNKNKKKCSFTFLRQSLFHRDSRGPRDAIGVLTYQAFTTGLASFALKILNGKNIENTQPLQ